MESLEIPLREHIPLSLRPVVVDRFWGIRQPQLASLKQHTTLGAFFDTYFRYYAEQCNLVGRHAQGLCSSIDCHQHIVDVARLLQQPLSKDEVRKGMSGFLRSTDQKQHDNSIDLVARLLLMIKFGDMPHECLGGRPVRWDHGTLPQFVHSYFSSVPSRGYDRIKLEKSFNAMNLQRISGIEILWTDNLADHLRLVNDDKAVAIFHHISFLEHQLNSSMFPPKFIEETLSTLSLLFPKYDPAARKWLARKSTKACHLDTRLVQIGTLNAEMRQMGNFTYWHDRLAILKEVYDDARPSTLSQWWYDRRNGPQWYTFWVALWVLVLTIFFGLVQCIIGALQVYKAFN